MNSPAVIDGIPDLTLVAEAPYRALLEALVTAAGPALNAQTLAEILRTHSDGIDPDFVKNLLSKASSANTGITTQPVSGPIRVEEKTDLESPYFIPFDLTPGAQEFDPTDEKKKRKIPIFDLSPDPKKREKTHARITTLSKTLHTLINAVLLNSLQNDVSGAVNTTRQALARVRELANLTDLPFAPLFDFEKEPIIHTEPLKVAKTDNEKAIGNLTSRLEETRNSLPPSKVRQIEHQISVLWKKEFALGFFIDQIKDVDGLQVALFLAEYWGHCNSIQKLYPKLVGQHQIKVRKDEALFLAKESHYAALKEQFGINVCLNQIPAVEGGSPAVSLSEKHPSRQAPLPEFATTKYGVSSCFGFIEDPKEVYPSSPLDKNAGLSSRISRAADALYKNFGVDECIRLASEIAHHLDAANEALSLFQGMILESRQANFTGLFPHHKSTQNGMTRRVLGLEDLGISSVRYNDIRQHLNLPSIAQSMEESVLPDLDREAFCAGAEGALEDVLRGVAEDAPTSPASPDTAESEEDDMDDWGTGSDSSSSSSPPPPLPVEEVSTTVAATVPPKPLSDGPPGLRRRGDSSVVVVAAAPAPAPG